MDELVKQVVAKTGLPEEQARQAAEVVVSFLKEKLPEPIAGQIDAVLGGSAGDISGMAEQASGLVGGLGGLLGKK